PLRWDGIRRAERGRRPVRYTARESMLWPCRRGSGATRLPSGAAPLCMAGVATRVTGIENALANFVINTLDTLGYGGIVLLMAIESACIPLPSEVIMPFSGFLVASGRFSLWGAALAGALGCTLGSAIAYGVGAYGGRPLILRYGRFILLSPHDVDVADRWFARFGEATAFFARLLPLIRTFISLPAGIAHMPFWRF